MTAALVGAGARAETVVTTDLFYDPRPGQGWLERGAAVVEMEAAALLQVADRREVAAACVLAVTDVPAGPGGESRRIDPNALERVQLRLGEAGYAAVRSP